MAKKEKQVKEKPAREKPVKEKKQKPAREPKPAKEKPAKKKEKPEGKAGLLDRFKKNPEDEGMDIMTEAKEPFSLQNFFDEHVVEKWKHMKAAMEARGIWAFLTSPFQAKGRLWAQIFILVIGIMFGVVPRASSMVSELQGQAYASEIAGLTSKTVGSISITPAASSNYKRMHMLAFIIEGKSLPSDPDKYEVKLAKAYGASDWQDVTYSWTMYPVTDTKRIMLVAIDQSKQKSGYGAFSLYIQLKDDDKVSKYMKESGAFEITLSSAQETTALYDKTGVHLSAVTANICGKGKITEKQAELADALQKYQMALEQAEAMPIDVTVAPTMKDLETYCLSQRVYRDLKDDSNTEDILSMEPISAKPVLSYDVVLTAKGIPYDPERIADLTANLSTPGETPVSEEEQKIMDEYEHVKAAKDAVLAAMENVNTEAEAWYNTISSYKLILNQTIKTGQFPLYAKVTETLDDDIAYLEGSPDGPDNKGDDGPVADYDGDDEYPEPTPAPEQPEEPEPTPVPVEEPEPTEEPSEEEPEPTEEPSEEPEEEPEEEPSEEPSEPEPTQKPYVPGTPTGGNPADSK